jgi:lipopolysaccharide transport system ATP-binding protein
MSNLAIRAANLSKSFQIGAQQARYSTLRDGAAARTAAGVRWLRGGPKTTESDEERTFWALRDVSFEIERGETVGVIGRNGAGKSTLLKVLSRITEPTSGYAELSGRVGSLLEVGTGFHLELSGRENIYLNGAILGMKRTEIMRKFDEIVEFAEVGKFIDTAVKHYSSGMYLRLAFSVAAHLEPEVLLVDEVLAVGDAVFQQRCLGKMSDVAAEGRTVVFVSHNLGAVKELCRSSIVLNAGSVQFRGPVADGLGVYTRGLLTPDESAAERGGWSETRIGDTLGPEGATISGGEPIHAHAWLHLARDLHAGNLFCIIEDGLGHTIVHQRVDATTVQGGDGLRSGRYAVHVEFPALWLTPGVYTVYFKLVGRTPSGADERSTSERVLLDVTGSVGGVSRALLAPRAQWTLRTG